MDRLREKPLPFIQKCVRRKRVYWTYHVNMRMVQRGIPRKYITESVDDFEVIEAYPDDKYLPSYLIYSKYEDSVFHVLFAVDYEEDNVRVITAYYPDKAEWGENLKTRRDTQ